jgi:hypothetical protein
MNDQAFPPAFSNTARALGEAGKPYGKSLPATSGFKTVRMVFSGKNSVRIEAD